MKLLSLLFVLFSTTSVFGQARLIVKTSHPDVTILVDGRFSGQKNTKEHVFDWPQITPGVIFRVPVQATLRGEIKTKIVDLECGRTVRLAFEFPDPPNPPILPPPTHEQTIKITTEPLKVDLKTEPLKVDGKIQVEPLKIEMEPLEIIIQDNPLPPRSSDNLIIIAAVISLLLLLILLMMIRLLILQGRLFKELSQQPSRRPVRSIPPSGDVEVEA